MATSSDTFDYYAELEIERTASLAEITSAYRRLARVHHPDRNRGNEEQAKTKFQRLQHAHETLSDPNQRDRYDNPQAAPNSAYDDDDDDVEYGFPYGHAAPSWFPFGFAPYGSARASARAYGYAPEPAGGYGYGRPREYEEWEREMDRREAEAAARDAEYQAKISQLQAERRARELAAQAKRDEKRAAKQASVDAVKAEKEQKFEEESNNQKQRWLEAKVISKDDRLSSCLHSDYCQKIELRKKVKCSSCSAKRGTMAFECPHCSVHLCQLCVTNFSTRRQKLAKKTKSTTSSPATESIPSATTSSTASTMSSPEEEPLEWADSNDEGNPDPKFNASKKHFPERRNGNYIDPDGNIIDDLESYLANINIHTPTPASKPATEKQPQKQPGKGANKNKKKSWGKNNKQRKAAAQESTSGNGQ